MKREINQKPKPKTSVVRKKVKKKVPRKRRMDGRTEKAFLRSIKALQLKCAGVSFFDIAAQLNISKKQAWLDVQNLLAFHLDESKDDTEKFRALENQRLDMYLQKLVPNVVNAPTDANGIVEMNDNFNIALLNCLRISRLRIRLNGLAPAQKLPIDETGKAVIPVILNRVTNFLTLIKEADPRAYEAFVKVTTDNGVNSVPVKPKQITKGKKK